MPNAHLEIIEHAGHIVTLEQPAAVNAALFAWLTRAPESYVEDVANCAKS